MPDAFDDTPRHEALPTPFACEVLSADGSALVRPQGELDLATVDQVGACLTAAREAGDRIVLDLGGLTFLDSTGVRLLLQWSRLSREEGFPLTLLPGGTAVQEVLELTGVTDLLPFARER